MTFASRRLRNIALTLILAVVLVSGLRLYDLSLRDSTFASGWLLIGGILLLCLFNVRKKLPFLPLISSSSWLQLHVYVGSLAALLFVLHTGFRLPNGVLETLLWLLFVAVAISGFIGIALARVLPNRLRQHSERVIFERIPELRAQISREVGELAMRSVSEAGSNTIAQYYATHLQRFLHRPRNLIAHIVGSNEPVAQISREIRSLERYLTPQGRELLREIEWRVLAKNDLDYQYALQLVLKGWLFVHIPATFCLIPFLIVHAVLAYAFTDGPL